MSALGSYDRAQIIVESLHGKVSYVGCLALDFMTGRFLGNDESRVRRTCASLSGFAKFSPNPEVITLRVIRDAVLMRDFDVEGVAQSIGGDITRKFAGLVEDLNTLRQNLGKPFPVGVWADRWSPWSRTPYYVEADHVLGATKQIKEFLAALEDDLKRAGSAEMLSFLNTRRLPDPTAAGRWLKQIIERAATPASESYGVPQDTPQSQDYIKAVAAVEAFGDRTFDPSDDRGHEQLWGGLYEISIESSGIPISWLVDGADASKDSKRIRFDDADSILFSIEAMAADPRCHLQAPIGTQTHRRTGGGRRRNETIYDTDPTPWDRRSAFMLLSRCAPTLKTKGSRYATISKVEATVGRRVSADRVERQVRECEKRLAKAGCPELPYMEEREIRKLYAKYIKP